MINEKELTTEENSKKQNSAKNNQDFVKECIDRMSLSKRRWSSYLSKSEKIDHQEYFDIINDFIEHLKENIHDFYSGEVSYKYDSYTVDIDNKNESKEIIVFLSADKKPSDTTLYFLSSGAHARPLRNFFESKTGNYPYHLLIESTIKYVVIGY